MFAILIMIHLETTIAPSPREEQNFKKVNDIRGAIYITISVKMTNFESPMNINVTHVAYILVKYFFITQAPLEKF